MKSLLCQLVGTWSLIWGPWQNLSHKNLLPQVKLRVRPSVSTWVSFKSKAELDWDLEQNLWILIGTRHMVDICFSWCTLLALMEVHICQRVKAGVPQAINRIFRSNSGATMWDAPNRNGTLRYHETPGRSKHIQIMMMTMMMMTNIY